MKIVAFLPAKGSSSRIFNKNTKLLDGKPLFIHTLEKLISCDFIDEVYLDTDSNEIIDLASNIKCNILRRSQDLATNSTNGNELFMNEVRQVNADIYIQILCTSPFIRVDTIKAGIEAITNPTLSYDSAFLVNRAKLYTWSETTPNYDLYNIPNSIDLPDSIVETMGLYIINRSAALETNRRIGNSPYMIQSTPIESIDVNFPEDFDLANNIAAGLRESERKLLNNIKHQISSCLLSDILDDYDLKNQVIKGLTPNIPNSKFIGRAKTLKLKSLAPSEDFAGIYSALHSYETIVPHDVIVVENEESSYAYFGELNAHLALRAGASAVVVGGKTRDSNDVIKLGLPIFSMGNTCQDVRGRATLESINKQISINSVLVTPGDLIFGDSEGIVVIPRHVEIEILSEASSRSLNERHLLEAISQGTDVKTLLTNHGNF